MMAVRNFHLVKMVLLYVFGELEAADQGRRVWEKGQAEGTHFMMYFASLFSGLTSLGLARRHPGKQRKHVARAKRHIKKMEGLVKDGKGGTDGNAVGSTEIRWSVAVEEVSWRWTSVSSFTAEDRRDRYSQES